MKLKQFIIVFAISLVFSLNGVAIETASLITLNNGETLTLPDFPYFIKKGVYMEFHAGVTTFDTLLIGKGYGQYRGDWIEITNNSISHKHFEQEENTRLSVDHTIAIKNDISVAMSGDDSGTLSVTITSNGNTFSTTFSTWAYEANYTAFAMSKGSSLYDVELSADNSDFSKTIWMFGDSYAGVNIWRWPGCLKEMGYFNFLLDGIAGLNSRIALIELKRLLHHGTPRYIFWSLGMCDAYDSYVRCLDDVRSICDSKGITLLCATMPTTPTCDREDITAYVRNSGLRYVDFYKAVGTNSKGEWTEGYLASDNVHPTAIGAQALAKQILLDFPEVKGEWPLGDVNCDFIVDVADIATVISVMSGSANGSVVDRADVNGDGTVDVADIASIISEMAARARLQEIED